VPASSPASSSRQGSYFLFSLLLAGQKLCADDRKWSSHRGNRASSGCFFFRWDISVICRIIVLNLALKVFTSLYFRTSWPNWHNCFFGHLRKIRSTTEKKTSFRVPFIHATSHWRQVSLHITRPRLFMTFAMCGRSLAFSFRFMLLPLYDKTKDPSLRRFFVLEIGQCDRPSVNGAVTDPQWMGLVPGKGVGLLCSCRGNKSVLHRKIEGKLQSVLDCSGKYVSTSEEWNGNALLYKKNVVTNRSRSCLTAQKITKNFAAVEIGTESRAGCGISLSSKMALVARQCGQQQVGLADGKSCVGNLHRLVTALPVWIYGSTGKFSRSRFCAGTLRGGGC